MTIYCGAILRTIHHHLVHIALATDSVESCVRPTRKITPIILITPHLSYTQCRVDLTCSACVITNTYKTYISRNSHKKLEENISLGSMTICNEG